MKPWLDVCREAVGDIKSVLTELPTRHEREPDREALAAAAAADGGDPPRLAATLHIDKARSIIHGLVGEKKIVLRPTANYLTAELAGDYAGLVRLAVPNIKVVAVTRIERVTRGL